MFEKRDMESAIKKISEHYFKNQRNTIRISEMQAIPTKILLLLSAKGYIDLKTTNTGIIGFGVNDSCVSYMLEKAEKRSLFWKQFFSNFISGFAVGVAVGITVAYLIQRFGLK